MSVINIELRYEDSSQIFKETCPVCGGGGEYHVSDEHHNHKQGCAGCGGSGSQEHSNIYDKYVGKNTVKKGSGKIKRVYKFFPCRDCGKKHEKKIAAAFHVLNESLDLDKKCQGEGWYYTEEILPDN